MPNKYGQQELVMIRSTVRQIVAVLSEQRNATADADRPDGKIGVLTKGDLLAEQMLVAAIQADFPDDHILTEESGMLPGTSDRTWIFDPMDGSKEFRLKIPECCICAVLHDPDPLLAVVMNPYNQDQFTAVQNRGAALNGVPLEVPLRTELQGSRIIVSGSELKRGWWDSFPLPVEAVGSIAWKIVEVAAGRADATITYTPKYIWDVAAAVLIAREAGCIVTDGKGQPVELKANTDKLTAGLIVSAPGIAEELANLSVPWIADRPSNQMDAR